jgi:hypothetical protein
MAKRSRGRIRPGQRRPLDRPARPATSGPARDRRPTEPAEAAPRAAVGLTPEEEARAAELERRTLETERPATPAPRRAAAAAVAVPRGSRLLDPSEEYAYVARDLRRILIVQGSLVGILAVLWVLIEGLRIVRL